MKVLRYLMLVFAVLALVSSSLFAQCSLPKPVLYFAFTNYMDLTGAPNVPGEFCPFGTGNPANAPALRLYQFDIDQTSAFKSYGGGAPYHNLWQADWICNQQTIGSGTQDPHFFQWFTNANLNAGGIGLSGCPGNNERIVAEVSFPLNDGTATHSGMYMAVTAPFSTANSGYDFEPTGVSVLNEIPQPLLDMAVPDAGSNPPTACCFVQITIPNPTWFTDAGEGAQVAATPSGNLRNVVKGYQFLYVQSATAPTSADPADYSPVKDPADCTADLSIQPLGSGQTQVQVAVPATASTDPYYFVALPVYETSLTGAIQLATLAVSKNSDDVAEKPPGTPSPGFFACSTTFTALEFESFHVTRTPEGAKIEWTMADEEDLAYYAVEKRDYYALGGYYTFPDGVLESEGQLRYSYTDKSFDPTSGQKFYRIVAYKYDGTSVVTPSFTFKAEISKSPKVIDRTRGTSQDGGLRTRTLE